MKLDGGCRVGVFMQKMTATIQKNGKGYSGTFQDGAAGKGLDVVSGNVVNDRKVVFGLNRKALKGAMQARLPDDNSMVVTVSVRVEAGNGAGDRRQPQARRRRRGRLGRPAIVFADTLQIA